jgi:ribonucleoside-diphosphate reductase alpha chain
MKTNKNNFQKMRSEILRRRYRRKNAEGKVIETEKQMFRRVADVIAAVEVKYGLTKKQVEEYAEKFYQVMKNLEFLPNSPTLMNAGRPKGLLSACYVLPVPDSIDGIFDSIKQTALIQKAGGGTGFDFSELRPTGDIVRSSGGRTSGPISFMRVFSEATNAIQQGAFRRGANMGMMNITHPDILKFITAKENPSAFNNFNISVKVTNAFMKQIIDNPNAPHIVTNPRTKKRYAIPHSVEIHSYSIDDLLPADRATKDCYTLKEIWDIIINNAWATGEPGICFIDLINKDNPTPNLGPIKATNPCGEQPLLFYESCNLGSINISKFVNRKNQDIDWQRLTNTITLAVRFLDNVIDANYYPIHEIEKRTLGNRKIGLGIMGFWDTLVLLGIKYDSEQAVEFAEKLASFIQDNAHKISQELAKERGCFLNWKGSIWDTKYHRKMRNASVTTIAPTGTISLIAGCNGGIEPIFSIISERQALDGEKFIQINPLVEKLGTKQSWLSEKVQDLLCKGVAPKDIPDIPKELSNVLVTAHEIAPEWHVRIQAAFQKYTDNAVSKTINLSSDAIIEDVDKAFRLTHKLNGKGTTVFRDGSRDNQVISTTKKIKSFNSENLLPRPRPRKTIGQTIKFRMGCGTLFVNVNKDDKGLCEVFANLGKAGGCPAQSEATCRVVSAALRSGVDAKVLIEQLKGIRCLSTITRRKDNKDIDVLSCPDAIARAIEEVLGDNCQPVGISQNNECPECHYPLRRESGCNVCDRCGFSKCG